MKRLLFALTVFALLYTTSARGSFQGKDTSVMRISESILFIGNSFTFAHGSQVMYYHPHSVTDLNNTNFGGVPALFKT